ncbi:MAG: apolipoprotein N-acyltransferase [Ramlibacter sp.]|nr:apolipoprotein N-acyltransferase [Ramlibacter sp.]
MSIAAPWDGQPQWWLQIASLAVLSRGIAQAPNGRSAAIVAWAFGTAWLAGTWWWLFISMHTYGGLAAPLAAMAVLGLAAFLASYCGLAGAVIRAFATRNRVIDALLFACAWLGAELLRVTLFTGFPWGEGGYAHVDGPLAFLAPYIGVHGITLIAALLACGLAQVAAPVEWRSWKNWRVIGATVGLLAACSIAATPNDDSPATSKLSVALLQGNIPQDEKFEGGSGIPLALEWYGVQLRDTKASLTIAPETSIPMLPQQLPAGYLDAVTERFAKGDQAALVGIPLGGFREGYTNSALGFKPGADVYRYDKYHLVPFGEFIPPLFKWFVHMMNIPLGDFNRGSLTQRSFVWQGQRIAPNICYEDLFGEELGVRFAQAEAAPTIFVNVSNIGWFGDSTAIDQHLQISRMRSLEFQRPMLRATNTGATVIIDHRGRVTHSLARLTRGVLTGEVEGRTNITPYAAWVSRLGLWPFWLLAFAVTVFAAWRSRRSV